MLLETSPVPAGISDQWQTISVEPYILTPNLRAWAFRVLVPAALDESLNSVGHWGWYQQLGGKPVIGQTQLIPLWGRGASQSLVIVSPSNSPDVVVAQTDVGLAYSIHSWIDAAALELWGYTY